MRIMFLNHSFVRHSATLEAHIRKLLAGYASPGTTFELAYPDDLGGGAVLSLLGRTKSPVWPAPYIGNPGPGAKGHRG